MEKQGQRHRQLVLVPFPFQGHINPMLQLGTILHSKGFSITIAHTQFNFPNPSNHPDFIFLPILDELSYKDLTEDFLACISSLNVNCKVPLQQSLSQMIENQGHQDEPPCIIYDGIMYFAEAVAHHLKLPSIVLRISSATNLLTYYAYPKLQEKGCIPLQDSKSLDLVPGLHPLRFKDLPVHNFKYLDSLLQLRASARDIRSTSAIIYNTMDCLEQSSLAQIQQLCQVPMFPIGPMHKIMPSSSSSLLEEDTSCIAWLDKQAPNSVIYVSLGSIASIDEKELAEMAWGLANSKQPLLWVLRPGSIQGSEKIQLLPQSFKKTVGERGCIVKWAPQKEVLAHSAVGEFWSHCGWNSTLESLCEEVPMICRPSFGDQRVNARFLSHVWKVGLELENELERGELERAIRKLLVDTEREEMRQRASDLKEKIELCIQKGGSSYNSLIDLVEFIMSVDCILHRLFCFGHK